MKRKKRAKEGLRGAIGAILAVALSSGLIVFSTVGTTISMSRSLFGQASSTPAPDFVLTDLTGRTISLSDYKGKVLFLNFWATWCPPCRAEIPDFIEAYKENKDRGLEILGISVDTKGKAAVSEFVEKYKINYPVVLESRSKTQKLIEDYQPGQFIPATIIIDKQGLIRHKHVGQMDKSQLLGYFQKYAGE